MANFFDFDTAMPALGAGTMEMGSELMEAPEDEETFDILNDETFGDMGDGDYNWEEEHEKFSSFHKDIGESENHDHLSNDQYGLHEESLEQSISQLVVDDDEIDDPAIMTITKRQPIPRRKDVNLDNLFGPSSPPGFLSSDHLGNVKRIQVSPGKGNIWGSPVQNSPVPAKEEGMQNLLQMLKGPSANGHHGEIKDPSIVHAGKSISSSFSEGNKYRREDIAQSRPRAMTVEQLEMEMRGEVQGSRPHKPPSPSRDHGRTPGAQLPIGTPPPPHHIQQHIQSQKHRDSRSSPITILGRGIPHSSVMNKHTPSPGAKMSPQVMCRSLPSPPTLMSTLTARSSTPPPSPLPLSPTPHSFTSQLMRPKSPSPSPRLSQQLSLRMQAALLLQNHMSNTSPLNLISSVVGIRGMLPNSPPPGGPPFGRGDKPNGPPPFMSPRPRGPFPGPPGPGPFSDPRDMRGPHPRGPPPPPHLRQQLFNGPGRGMRGPPPPFPGPPGRGYPIRDPYRDGYNSHNGRMIDGRGDGPWRGRGDWRGGRGMGRQPRPRRDSYQSGEEDYYDDELENSFNRDPYANLMTQREKEWIIKIQLMQLHTDNPYVDDYYFTTWQMQRLAREHQKTPEEDEKKKKEEKEKKKEPKLVLPQLAKVEMKSYRPVQFEGSLGRLTSSSVHNPRQIIDVDAKVIQSDEDPKARELRKFKQLLIHVEKTYDILLAIDELEKKALALPDEARPAVLLERHRKIGTLQQWLIFEGTKENSFLKLLTLKKGIKLLSRSLPLFDKNQSSTLLLLVVQHVALLTKKEIQQELVKGLEVPIVQCLKACDLESLVVLSQMLMMQADNKANVAANALQIEFGSVVIWSLVSRGADIYQNVSPVDLDVKHQNEWSQFLYWVAQGVENVDRDLLCSPSSPSPSSLSHLQQLLDRKTYYAIEDKLHSILADKKQS